MRQRGSSRFGVLPWRGADVTIGRVETCRVCGVAIQPGTARYGAFATGGTYSHVECGFRTREECATARRVYFGPGLGWCARVAANRGTAWASLTEADRAEIRLQTHVADEFLATARWERERERS